jgi:hypothetical protein
LSLSISIVNSPDKLTDILVAYVFIKSWAIGLYGIPCLLISEYARVKRPSPALKGLDLVDFAKSIIAIKDTMAVNNFHFYPVTFLHTKFPEEVCRIKIQKGSYGLLFRLRQGDSALSMATVAAKFTGKNFIGLLIVIANYLSFNCHASISSKPLNLGPFNPPPNPEP